MRRGPPVYPVHTCHVRKHLIITINRVGICTSLGLVLPGNPRPAKSLPLLNSTRRDFIVLLLLKRKLPRCSGARPPPAARRRRHLLRRRRWIGNKVKQRRAYRIWERLWLIWGMIALGVQWPSSWGRCPSCSASPAPPSAGSPKPSRSSTTVSSAASFDAF
jgi:hypothetical protein